MYKISFTIMYKNVTIYLKIQLSVKIKEKLLDKINKGCESEIVRE